MGKTESSSYTLWDGLIPPRPMVGVEESIAQLPKVFYLRQNYLNPVISGTHIEYGLPKVTSITVKIYNVAGRAIQVLVLGRQKPGIYRIYWDVKDGSGNRVTSGIYFCRIEASEFKAAKRLTILR